MNNGKNIFKKATVMFHQKKGKEKAGGCKKTHLNYSLVDTNVKEIPDTVIFKQYMNSYIFTDEVHEWLGPHDIV